MRQTIFSICFLSLVSFSASAGNGDTISVRSHDKVHMNWNGAFDRWAKFPAANLDVSRIILFYTIGCPTSGCSDWDYTNRIYLRHRPGYKDSSLKQAPSYTINGQSPLKYRYNNYPLKNYVLDTVSMLIVDSITHPSQILILYSDSTKPLEATDTLNVWNEVFSYTITTGGRRIDSVFRYATDSILLKLRPYYQVFDKIIDYEIARAITPYGANLANNWSITYKIDVTDFMSLLRDSVEIRSFYDGWSDGFAVSLDFKFIEGKPARKPIKVLQLWQGYFPYGNTNDPIENYLDERNVSIEQGAKYAKLRILQTGHGFGGNENCAEFCPKYNYVLLNGTQRFQNLIWKADCGLNPVYPQAGTWVYDRANWCPGAEVGVYEHELTAFIDSNSFKINVDMEPFTNINNSSCGYNFSGQVVFYEEYEHVVDAALESILAPSNEYNFNRYNPICNNPVIRVRNTGKADISSILFKYGISGGSEHFSTWTGLLKAGESKDISLASINWSGSVNNSTFIASILDVNNAPDHNSYNNTQRTNFMLPPFYPNQFVIYFKSNNAAAENHYKVKDQAGNTIREKSNFSNNLVYRDTLTLGHGCYRFEFNDDDGDGLSFFANSDGTGTLRFLRMNGTILKGFPVEFGRSIVHEFTAGYALSMEDSEPSFNVYPNPATNKISIDLSAFSGREKTYVLRDVLGRELEKGSFAEGEELGKLDLSLYPKGVLYLSIQVADRIYTKSIVLN